MSYRIEWSRHALADLQSIRQHIAVENPRAAQVTVGKILALADALAELPSRGRSVAGTSQARELIVGNYGLRYLMAGDVVVVVRVKHVRQQR